MSLSSKPDFSKMEEWLKPLINWEKFGTFLPGISQDDIQKIEEDYIGVDKRKRALCRKWLQLYTNATWQDVITALKKADYNALADDILTKLGPSGTQTTANSSSKGATKEADIDLNRLSRILQSVLQKHFANLRHSLHNCVPSVAAELYSVGLISEAVKDAPTYDSMIHEFVAGMNTKRNVLNLEEYCQLFLKSLSSQGGPVNAEAKVLAEDWKEEVTKLGISFNIKVD